MSQLAYFGRDDLFADVIINLDQVCEIQFSKLPDGTQQLRVFYDHKDPTDFTGQQAVNLWTALRMKAARPPFDFI